jgi:cysteine desulfurase/selenocysteine lyase
MMSNRDCYLDHASTAFPRAPGVAEAVCWALDHFASPNRGTYARADEAAHVVQLCRQAAAKRFGIDDTQRVIFTAGCTDAINQVIHGMLGPGDTILACASDHNAVLRPLHQRAAEGLNVRLLPANKLGIMEPESLRSALRTTSCDLLILTHASNVTGAVVALEEYLSLAAAAGVPVLLDAAQSAGLLPLDLDRLGVAATAIPGHKGLAGPPGIGLLCLGVDVNFRPLRQGGTGFNSESPVMPSSGPDRYEAGTPNVPGIAGLRAALEAEPPDPSRMMRLRDEACRFLATLEGVTVYWPLQDHPAVPVLSFTVANLPPEVVSLWLAEQRIAVRAGLHCSPGAHRALGVFNQGGAVRVSFGPNNSEEDLDQLFQALTILVQECAAV